MLQKAEVKGSFGMKITDSGKVPVGSSVFCPCSIYPLPHTLSSSSSLHISNHLHLDRVDELYIPAASPLKAATGNVRSEDSLTSINSKEDGDVHIHCLPFFFDEDIWFENNSLL